MYKCCTKCKILKSLNNFHTANKNQNGDYWCKLCRKEQKRQLITRRKLNNLCRTCGKSKDKLLVLCRQCRETQKRYLHSPEVAELRKLKLRLRNRQLKLDTFNKYGGPICRCCGEATFEFLSIDHIHGNGNRHRKQIKSERVSSIYYWLKKNAYPMGFQVLCFNCNLSRGMYSYCPHENKLKIVKIQGER